MKYVAALTPHSGYTYYPPYINFSEDDAGRVVVTLRGNEYPDGKCGSTDTATFDKSQFATFIAEAAHALNLEAKPAPLVWQEHGGGGEDTHYGPMLIGAVNKGDQMWRWIFYPATPNAPVPNVGWVDTKEAAKAVIERYAAEFIATLPRR